MIKYIRDMIHKVYSKVKTIHQHIKQVDVNNLDELEEGQVINPYTALKTWLIDYVLVLGTLTTVPYFMFTYQPKTYWLYPLTFGCIWWLSEQAIRRYTDNRR